MIRLIGFESDSLRRTLDRVNNWPSARQTKFKDEFKYMDLRYAYANDQHSVVIIYDNLTNNEEIDKI